ncbi:MAG: hypothetical protein ACRKGH_05005 [Dehalogenimonas sp.]
MKNTKLWTMITAAVAVIAVGGGLMAMGEEGTAVHVHAAIGVLALVAALITAFSASK